MILCQRVLPLEEVVSMVQVFESCYIHFNLCSLLAISFLSLVLEFCFIFMKYKSQAMDLSMVIF